MELVFRSLGNKDANPNLIMPFFSFILRWDNYKGIFPHPPLFLIDLLSYL